MKSIFKFNHLIHCQTILHNSTTYDLFMQIILGKIITELNALQSVACELKVLTVLIRYDMIWYDFTSSQWPGRKWNQEKGTVERWEEQRASLILEDLPIISSEAINKLM
jgi:hypothetical protein